MAIDETNSIYLVGNTCSTDFPYSQPAPVLNGQSSFLIKIAADGTWNFAVGLPVGVTANRIRSAGAGEIALGGECTLNSIAWSAQFLPPNATPKTDACYVRLAPNGLDIVAATIIGASNGSVATDIALDASGNAYLTGETSPVDFPTNGYSWVRVTQPLNFALFAATVSRDGKTLQATALFNEENLEVDPKITVAPSGEVVVAGITQSSQFPITPGAFQTVRMG
ncbi:MAG TPA: SBBP repeat-containing protein, partial [Bryobacteraceae bacterium]|nr:SBBP repeat-containing protein [Bryobacteraceae bacterium]